MHTDCWIQQVTTRIGAVTCWINSLCHPSKLLDLAVYFNSEVDQLISKVIVIIHHLGLGQLIDVGEESVKPGFDILVQRIADQYGALAMLPPVKGEERGSVKVNVRYGGDASQLSDIVRATLKFPMGQGVLQNMYTLPSQ